MSITVCIPVLKRYDLLRNFLASLNNSTVPPAGIIVVDNGRDAARAAYATAASAWPVEVMTPDEPLGLAVAWNWFIQNTPSERLICNDDLLFADNTLELIGATEGSFVSALAGTNACSCFLLRDACVEKVGLFDEAISPGYAYFEDCDYIERMIQNGIPITPVEAGVVHIGSQTIASNTSEEWQQHHDRFLTAQGNFVKKWGRLPNVPGPHWPRPEEVA